VGGVNLRKTGQMEKFTNKFAFLDAKPAGDKAAAQPEAKKEAAPATQETAAPAKAEKTAKAGKKEDKKTA
jgi:hypothetical protein